MPIRQGGSFSKNASYLATLQLAADDHLATGINSVDLEDRLGDV